MDAIELFTYFSFRTFIVGPTSLSKMPTMSHVEVRPDEETNGRMQHASRCQVMAVVARKERRLHKVARRQFAATLR